MASSYRIENKSSVSCTDTISDISFCICDEFFVCSSWDNTAKVYGIQNGVADLKATIQHDAPALCCDWYHDGSKVFSGGASQFMYAMDAITGQTMTIKAHDMPVKSIKWFRKNNVLITGSWDKTMKCWDLRQSAPAAVINLPDKCYAMDATEGIIVAATANRQIVVIDPKKGHINMIDKQIDSPLKMQTRCVAGLANEYGYILGSIEGKAAVQYLADTSPYNIKSFSFKCHKNSLNECYSVNTVKVNPRDTRQFLTGGSDKTLVLWDKQSKQKSSDVKNVGDIVTAAAFSYTSNYMAYCTGYDWSKGYEHANMGSQSSIKLCEIVQNTISTTSHHRTGYTRKF